jgi:hypothetical protein
MKKAPTSKRPTPKDLARLGWLTGRKLTPKQQAEHEALFVRWGEWSIYRDQSGEGHRGADGELYFDCDQRRMRRTMRVRARQAKWIEPDAKRGKKQVATCRSIASAGGKASPAKYKDGDIEKALIRYKRDNPKRTLWDACSALIRPGKELSKYKRVIGLWQRVKRMDKSGLDIGVEAFFDSL